MLVDVLPVPPFCEAIEITIDAVKLTKSRLAGYYSKFLQILD